MLKIKNDTEFGRGLFSSKKIKKNQLIESCPVLIFSEEDVLSIQLTIANNYIFTWGEDSALALGKSSLLNHSENSNVEAICDYENNTINFYATKDIKKNEQLFLNYGYDVSSSLEDRTNQKNLNKKNKSIIESLILNQ